MKVGGSFNRFSPLYRSRKRCLVESMAALLVLTSSPFSSSCSFCEAVLGSYAKA
ncbi:hypothetical protein PR003_g814 [Phytophthora rubi]|uniref:Uncharacterized protein n=1 Tax=Phytophthora rubi TaxID=129364 RepID=A0A6A4G8T5_9STRA|nr:hypothetical protein PR002_g690 [Phytophthora rubi]KAE9359325.1 hypothetical protein PR003_g814 [Phytophthora rubi]